MLRFISTFVGNLILVAVGVFGAIQADRWIADFERACREVEYLERLQADIRFSIHENLSKTANMQRYAGHANVVFDSLANCRVSPDRRDEFASGLFTVGKVNFPYFATGTVQELLATGRLSVIHSAEVRTSLLEVMQATEALNRLDEQIAGRLAPHIVYIESLVLLDIRNPISGAAGVSWEQLTVELDSLCNDQRFIAAVSSTRNMTYTVIQASFDVIVLLEQLSVQLELEYRKKKSELEQRSVTRAISEFIGIGFSEQSQLGLTQLSDPTLESDRRTSGR